MDFESIDLCKSGEYFNEKLLCLNYFVENLLSLSLFNREYNHFKDNVKRSSKDGYAVGHFVAEKSYFKERGSKVWK